MAIVLPSDGRGQGRRSLGYPACGEKLRSPARRSPHRSPPPCSGRWLGSPYGEEMRPFDRVVLIFNPASTGNAPALAAELRDELQRRQPDLPVTLQPTEHAGHARDLARDAARTGRPLLVSVSGDGGYNEVVDGTMKAGNDAAVWRRAASGERQRPPARHPGTTAGRRHRHRIRQANRPVEAHRRGSLGRDQVCPLLHRAWPDTSRRR